VLIVQNLHFEAVELSETMTLEIIEALKAFVKFNQCRDIVFKRSNQEAYLNTIRGYFQ
jgi:hypothetical protein